MGILSTIFGGNAEKKSAKRNLAEFKTSRDASIADIAPYATAGTNLDPNWSDNWQPEQLPQLRSDMTS